MKRGIALLGVACAMGLLLSRCTFVVGTDTRVVGDAGKAEGGEACASLGSCADQGKKCDDACASTGSKCRASCQSPCTIEQCDAAEQACRTQCIATCAQCSCATTSQCKNAMD